VTTAYNRPAWFVRKVYNPIAQRFGLGGAMELVITGRASGQPQSVPVMPLDLGGVTYLVSVRGDAEWVRNLEAADRRGALVRKGGRRDFTATPVDVAQRAPIIEAYRKMAGKTVDPFWKKLPDDADHPTYVLSSAG
jgi:hypothetical protein